MITWISGCAQYNSHEISFIQYSGTGINDISKCSRWLQFLNFTYTAKYSKFNHCLKRYKPWMSLRSNILAHEVLNIKPCCTVFRNLSHQISCISTFWKSSIKILTAITDVMEKFLSNIGCLFIYFILVNSSYFVYVNEFKTHCNRFYTILYTIVYYIFTL